MPSKFTGLGRGLGSLIPQKVPQETQQATAIETAALPSRADNANRVLNVPVSDIIANPEQPRSTFGHQELEDLMNSIREHGIIQPLTVTTRVSGGYELIAGERRFRAAKMLGMSSVPVIVRQAERDDKLILALIENIQREDLNSLEEARGYQRLVAEFGMTQEAVSKQVGKARSTVANSLRLLELPMEIQEAIATGAVSAGSARAMLSLPDDRSRIEFFHRLMEKRLSTRQVEENVRTATGPKRKDPAILAAESTLREKLGTRVEIKKRGSKGSVVISFYSDEEYDDLMRKLQ